jgi:hypothetical protein
MREDGDSEISDARVSRLVGHYGQQLRNAIAR